MPRAERPHANRAGAPARLREGASPRMERVGDTEIPAGSRAAVLIGEPGDPWAIPAVVLVGAAAGPRLALLGAPRGFEAATALAIDDLGRTLAPATLRGTVVAVPVARPAGRLTAGGRPLTPLPLPGDPGGGRRARLALALAGAALVGSDALVVLGAPRPGRCGALTARGHLADPRVRRLAHACGAIALEEAESPPGSPARLVTERGGVALELLLAGPDAHLDRTSLVAALERLLAELGMVPPHASRRRRPEPLLVHDRVVVAAPADGRLDQVVPPGSAVAKGTTLAALSPLARPSVEGVRAPRAGVLLEAPSRLFALRGAVLFVIGLCRGDTSHLPRPAPPPPAKFGVGWVERVSLPRLGLRMVQAKIDTGARTSALHVLGVRPLEAPGVRRPKLEVVLPGRGSRAQRTLVLAIREYVDVRDTSGRTERRPLIETDLELGPMRRRIRLTLTNRGDMRYPLLVGRTALGADVVVDPSRRFVLGDDDKSVDAIARAPDRRPSSGGARILHRKVDREI